MRSPHDIRRVALWRRCSLGDRESVGIAARVAGCSYRMAPIGSCSCRLSQALNDAGPWLSLQVAGAGELVVALGES